MTKRERVFVCGGGHQGLSMAAHLALNGEKVSLWNRTASNIADVIETRTIESHGVVSGRASLELATCDFAAAVSDCVMVATPSSAHKDVARLLAPHAHEDMVVVLNPGRTFGAIEFAQTLRECGVKKLPAIAEAQTIVYTCRRDSGNTTMVHALKNDVGIAALRGCDIQRVLKAIPSCLRNHFKALNSVAYTSLSNVGMVLHCAPVLMNVGWIETEDVDFKYYYHGISPTIAGFLEKIDAERVAVARSLGYEVETTAEWMSRTYRVEGSSIYDCIQRNKAYELIDAPTSVRCRYVLEDVPNGLVPIEHVGKMLGVETPAISTTIDLAEAVLGLSFRKTGRRPSLKEIEEFF